MDLFLGWVCQPDVADFVAAVSLGWSEEVQRPHSNRCGPSDPLDPRMHLNDTPHSLQPNSQEGKQEFWELWSLFNIHDFKLDGILVSAGLAQIGKVSGARAACYALRDGFPCSTGVMKVGIRHSRAPAPPTTPCLALAPQLAGLILVVCFGSCMDVAAIQQDLPERIDFDHELVTVGEQGIVGR